jgi:hypothetical protein
MAEETKDGCVWNLGTPCGGSVEEKKLFHDQIKVPICENHFEEHKIIILLFNNGYEVEEILNQDAEWRKQEALTIQLSGLAKIDDVEP